MRYLIFSFCLMVLHAGCSQGNNDGEVKLAFNLEEGSSYNYEMEVDSKQEMGGKKMESSMAFTYLVEVVDDSSGIKTLKTTYNRIKMDMNPPESPDGENTDYFLDTDQPNTDTSETKKNSTAAMSNLFYAIKGKSFFLKIDQKGQILSVSGLDEMRETMIASMNLDAEKLAKFERDFRSQFNEANLKNAFTTAFNIYPDQLVKSGDSWQKDYNNILTTYTVEKISDNTVDLDMKADISIEQTKGKISGKMKIDKRSGMVIEGNSEMELEGQMKVSTVTTIKGSEIK